MKGQDFQDKLDALVVDLQTKGKGQTINILVRDESNSPAILPLSSDGAGIVNAGQLATVQAFFDTLKPFADDFDTESAAVSVASEAFRLARAPHQALIAAAANARFALQNALEADATYQAAKTALDTARSDVDYINARSAYQQFNVSENFGNLSDAKGKYVPGDQG